MSGLGVFFSLSDEEVQRLRELGDDAARLDFLCEVIEPDYFANYPDRKMDTDKAWDAMDHVLCGTYPLDHVVMGGEAIYEGDDYIMILKTPDQVWDVAAALPAVTKATFRARYDAIDPKAYDQPKSDEDFDYTWENFEDVRRFWLKAASERRFVVFTADP